MLKGGLNVLYIEGSLRVEQKFIRRALDASHDIHVDFVRIDAQHPETRPPDLAERLQPGKYEVYILGDVDSTAFRESELKDLAETVEKDLCFGKRCGFQNFERCRMSRDTCQLAWCLR